jgi:hypothetical protein
MVGAVGATVATFGFVFYRDPWAPGWVTAAYSCATARFDTRRVVC